MFEAPMPLEIAPGRPLWERQRGRDYLVFVDESFYEFFGFNNPDGNFCHAGVGVPEHNYRQLQRDLAPLVQTYKQKIRRVLGLIPNEIKSSDLRRLSPRSQANFVRQLVQLLAEHSCFVAGFYMPTGGFIMEDVRVELLDATEEVPANYQALYDAARQHSLAAMAGPGQAGLISKLLFLPAAAIRFMLGAFGCRFRIQYDPRQGDEDQAVRQAIGDGMNHLLNLPEPLRQANNYLGMDVTRRSEDELGLQLADVVAGYVREFFRRTPIALTEGSTARLITATSEEPLQKMELMDGALFKSGSLQPMSARLKRSLTRRNMVNIVSYFYPVLASGILTCNTATGQERDLELSTGLIMDLLD